MISFLFSIESRPAMIASTAAQMGLVTAEALLEAFNYIEYGAMLCQGATHCSVACCILLAAIAYPEAVVCLSTPRTQRAAEERGGLFEVRM